MGGAALSPSASTAEVEKFGCLDCPEACRRIKPHCLTIIPSLLTHLVIREADEVSGVNSLLEMESEGQRGQISCHKQLELVVHEGGELQTKAFFLWSSFSQHYSLQPPPVPPVCKGKQGIALLLIKRYLVGGGRE